MSDASPNEAAAAKAARRAERRSRVIDAATALFRERGFDAVRTRDIARRARVSEATVFNYFEAGPGESVKELMLDEVAAEQLDAFIALMHVELAAVERSAFDRAVEAARVFAQAVVADRDLFELVTTHTHVWGAARTGVLRHKQETMIELVAELLRQGQRRGELHDELEPFMVAEAVLALLTNVATYWMRGYPPDRDPPEELDLVVRIEKHMDFLIRGATPDR
jgi:TetR/AcrR family fatty acid metabolism transcriptional regulator